MRLAPTLIAVVLVAGGVACGEDDNLGRDATVIGFDAEPDSGVVIDRCEPPRETCNGECINTETDPFNCGMCGMQCAASSFCMAGECVRICGGGLEACGASCVDPSSDRDHCGRCDMKCAADRDCRGGACVCPDRYTECHGVCVDSDTDVMHCGICDRACRADQTCNSGSCVCAGGERETDCTDGMDNDCDDQIDCADSDCVGTQRTCMGACGAGVETCEMGGTYSACTGGDGSAEICGDGIDQDCNGSDQRNEDTWEPNNDCASCPLIMGTDPNGVITARFDSIDDSVDCYKFMGDDGVGYPERITITLDMIPAGHDYDLYLYMGLDNCNARMPLASSAAFGEGAEMVDWGERFGTNDDAEYFVRVVRFSGHSCTEDYRLQINGLN